MHRMYIHNMLYMQYYIYNNCILPYQQYIEYTQLQYIEYTVYNYST